MNLDDGVHLANSLTWMDSRGAPHVRDIIGGFPSVDGYNLFAVLPWIRKTASVDSMTLFWLTNTRNIDAPFYDDGLIAKVGIDKSKLPPMKRSIDVLGVVDSSVASDIGLPAGVKVVVGSPDHQSACTGSGVALNTRWALKYVERFIGRRMDTLAMVGGGATSDVWCQIFADVLERTIRQTEAPLQANARGAALIASVALGYITWEDIPDLVPIAKVYEPNPANRALYDELFSVFLDIYRRNRALFRRLNG